MSEVKKTKKAVTKSEPKKKIAKTKEEVEKAENSKEVLQETEPNREASQNAPAKIESAPPAKTSNSDLEKRLSYCRNELAKNPPTQEMNDAVEEMKEALHGMRAEENMVFPQIKHKNGLQAYEGAEVEDSIECIIVHTKQENHFYKNKYDPRNPTAPDCYSPDGITATSEEPLASRCSKCPNNQYGSASDSKGKACKNFRVLYVQVGEGTMPFAIKVPPTSMKAAKEFLMNATTRYRAYWNVKTRISVYKKDEEQAYNNLRFEIVGKSSPEERTLALMIRNETLEFMENATMAPEEIEEFNEHSQPSAAQLPTEGVGGVAF